MKLNSVIEKYQKEFYKHGRSISSLFWGKNRDEQRFSAVEKFIPLSKETWSILDYGCGFGSLNQYLKKKRKDNFIYYGADVVKEFIESNKRNEPEYNYDLIASYKDIKRNYDYIAIVGVFNILYSESTEDHKKIVNDTISYLFTRCNKWISINFMTDNVDYTQKGAYHQNPIEIYNFAINNLSRRLVFDQSYLPYEFSLIIYKDDEIASSDLAIYSSDYFKK